MQHIGDVYDIVQFIVNAESGGKISPARFNMVLNMAQMTVFMRKYGNPAEYQPGRPIPRVAYEATQKITDDLHKFKVPVPMTINSDGQAPYPDDYIHVSSIRKNVTTKNDCTEAERRYVEVRILDDDKIGKILGSRIVNPTFKRPICGLYSEYIQFWPKNLVNVEFTYLRRPIEAAYAFSLTNGRPVYDSNNSVQLEWPIQVWNEIIVAALDLLGIHMREPQLAQYSQLKQEQGV